MKFGNYNKLKKSTSFQEKLKYYQKNYIGRPSPLYFANRITDYCGGAKIFFKRDELNHTGAHKINNVIGQALLAKEMGKNKIIAETGAGQHGVATATEAASLGVVGALILSYFQKSLTIETFKQSLLGATKTSCMIAFILAGSTFLSLAMGFTGLPRNLAIWIQNMELSPYVLIFVLMIFYIILGMFLDGISAVVLTMAIIEPMIRQAGFDMIWFGIFLVIVVEMAQITPPVGFNLFVLQGMANKDMGFIAKSAFPLFLLMIFAVLLIVLFPQIALWMPEQMIQNIN